MSNRYLAWTLLIAACGLQAYFVFVGTRYFIDLETVMVPRWLYSFSRYLFDHYLPLPYFATITITTFFLPVLSNIFSCVLLVLRRKVGWNLSLAVDVFFALPSLILVSLNSFYSLKHHLHGVPYNLEVLLLILSSLHILLLCSPPIRTLIFAHPAPQAANNNPLFVPVIPAR